MLNKTNFPRSEKPLPNHRWHIYPKNRAVAEMLGQETGLPPLVTQVLLNRGIDTIELARDFLRPEGIVLPTPLAEFPDLAKSLDLLENCIAKKGKIAICGDYDADGMTSTALLLRALRLLGALVDYAIPSRMQEGYGINTRIVEEFHREGVQLILTVDNGISAVAPIRRARELGVDTIITDHHDLPPELPRANAILNPKLLPESSPYRGVAGVGVAYILAMSLAERFGQVAPMIRPLRELLTLGTIADLAPLTGVNRRWVKWGLKQLPQSKIPGVQALIQVSGAATTTVMKPDEIGFRLGPRINAVGRIGDPQVVIQMLTTEDMGEALTLAMQCEQTNQHRQFLCEQIEQEAIAWIESQHIDLLHQRVLLVVQPEWHHGVIGIVASRLVERYGVPVFIGTYEDNGEIVRGSARGIPEFNVFEALQFCHDVLHEYGGHRAAGGFSLPAEYLADFGACLQMFARQCLEPHHLKPVIHVDACLDLKDITPELFHATETLDPCGIENPAPVFWTPNVEIIDQRLVGKGHIKLTVQSGAAVGLMSESKPINGIAWRWQDYFPLPPRLDIAYKLRENTWKGNTSIELEIISARRPT